MAISSVSSNSSQSVFQSPGVRPAENTARVNPVPAADQQAQQTAATQQDNQQTNTSPSETERQDAVASGRTRGSFVNITA